MNLWRSRNHGLALPPLIIIFIGGKMEFLPLSIIIFTLGFPSGSNAETITNSDLGTAMNRQTSLMFSRDNSGQTILRGAIDCKKWLHRKDTPLLSYYEGWVLGFVNGMAGGMALHEEVNFMRDSDPETIMLLMDKYCSDHKLKNTGDGALRIAFQLLEKKR